MRICDYFKLQKYPHTLLYLWFPSEYSWTILKCQSTLLLVLILFLYFNLFTKWSFIKDVKWQILTSWKNISKHLVQVRQRMTYDHVLLCTLRNIKLLNYPFSKIFFFRDKGSQLRKLHDNECVSIHKILHILNIKCFNNSPFIQEQHILDIYSTNYLWLVVTGNTPGQPKRKSETWFLDPEDSRNFIYTPLFIIHRMGSVHASHWEWERALNLGWAILLWWVFSPMLGQAIYVNCRKYIFLQVGLWTNDLSQELSFFSMI